MTIVSVRRPAPHPDPWRTAWPHAGGDHRRPAVIAARGIGGRAPENTVAALELAASMGAGWVSVEVRRTRDDVLVLLSSSDLRGTTDVVSVLPDRAPYRVEDLTFEEVRLLDVGVRHHPRFTGERVTRLGEALDRLGGRVGIVIDVPIGPRTAGIDALIVGELAQRPELRTIGARVAVRSRDLVALEAIAGDVPGTRTFYRLGPSAVRDSIGLVPPGMDGVTVPRGSLDAELVLRARERGLAVVVDRIGAPADVVTALRLGVAAVEVDEPRTLAAAVASAQGLVGVSAPVRDGAGTT